MYMNKHTKKYFYRPVSFYVVLLFLVMIFSAPSAKADTMSDLQSLLTQLQAQLSVLQNQSPTSAQNCVELTATLSPGATDAISGGQVSKLQQFLKSSGYYSYPTLTGYYGSVTAAAVSAWQSAHKDKISGFPKSGTVDAVTISGMARGCIGSNVEILSTTPVAPITLADYVKGEDLLQIKVDAENKVELSAVTVNIALPFVKAGSWKDMVKQVIFVSDDSQSSVKASIVDHGTVVSLLGENHDEVTVTFEIPSSERKDFTIASGVDSVFRVYVDFKPAEEVGGFGVTKGNSTGYVRATLVDMVDSNGQLITITNSPYGPHRLISSAY